MIVVRFVKQILNDC